MHLRAYRPRLERLEDRTVPSLTPGNAFSVAGGTGPAQTAVATAADGHFIVARATNATVGYTITVQVDNADGSARSNAIAVGQSTTLSVGQLAIAADAAGDFVVVWNVGPNPWTSDVAILARRFDATGNALGDAFQVNQNSLFFVNYPAVAMDPGGDFVVVWRNRNASNAYEIDAQRYNAAGVAQGGEFQVRPSATGTVGLPQVAMDAQGDFLVAWDGAGPSGWGSFAYARRYNAAGQPLSAPFQVSQGTGEASSPVVAMDAQGDSVIAWMGVVENVGFELVAQRYNAAGVAQGATFQVNQFTTGDVTSRSVAMDAQGDFAVTWQMDSLPQAEDVVPPGFGFWDASEEGGGIGTYGRIFSAAGQDLSGEFQVNQSTAGNSNPALVAVDARGDAIFAWTNTNQQQAGLYARRYSPTATGYGYDPATRTLSITATGGGHYFAYSQATNTGGAWANYTFNLDGVKQTYNTVALAHVIVTFTGSGNTAVINTNDTYTASDGSTHETAESVALGQGGGHLYRAGEATAFLRLSGFANAYGYLGHADGGALLASAGQANQFVTTPAYAYLTTPATMYFIGGAASVYGYAANATDVAYHYDGSSPSTFIVSGTAFSAMMGKDNGVSFYNEAVGFTHNVGIARHAGQDTAYFYDSPGNDVFWGSTSGSYLYRDNPDGTFAEFDFAAGFAQVYAVSSAGGTDYAYVYDATVNHVTGFHRLV
jgi:hypothetical protein